MKKVFVKTNNVKRFITMMNNLQQRAEGVPGMGLVYGEPGLGKTFAITWWAIQNNAVYIRCANNMSSRWLLEELVEELGEIPYTKFSDIFNQAVSQLIKLPRIIIVDEVDYITIDSKAVETLRDIHDKTDCIIVLIGMSSANRRLMRHKHLYDRISEIQKFETFTKSEISQIINELSEIDMTDCARNFIYSKTKRFRQIVKLINRAEQVAKANGLSSIDEIILKEVTVDDESNQNDELSNPNSKNG